MKIMEKKTVNRGMKWGVALLALAMAVMIPFMALAEQADQAATADAAAPAAAAEAPASATAFGPMDGRGGRGFGMMGGYGLDTSSLTEAQKTAYDSALALYEQVEDAVLADLVSAGVVAQADVDAYVAQRAAEKSLTELDQSGWTAEQYKTFYEANAKTGDDRVAAMQALADAGQLTQAQADALSAQGQSDLWSKIAQNSNTNSAIQTAISTIRQARQTLNSTLSDAGITGMGKGGMGGGLGMRMGGMGMRDGNGNSGRNDGQNGNSNRMTGRAGGRN
jgi:hypothetical protein